MGKKRLGRWVIVLFLLAALPGMTVVMAQGQEPVVKEADVAPAAVFSETGVGSSVWEAEPNNTMAQANEIHYPYDEVYGGQLYPEYSDVDYYKILVGGVGTAIIVNTDARSNGESTDTTVTVYDAAGNQIGYNDDMGPTAAEYDSLLYLSLPAGWYYVKVQNLADCNDECYYNLMVYPPLLISAAAPNLGTGNVEGISFRSEDILAFARFDDDMEGNPQHKWLMFLDGSDVGFTKPLVNLATGLRCFDKKCPSLIASFSANINLTDYQGIVRTAKPWDWVEFQVDRIGPNSAIRTVNGYSSIVVHSGELHGLTTTSEKLDALDMYSSSWSPNDYYTSLNFSTVGAASVPQYGGGILRSPDEDMFRSGSGSSHPTTWDNFKDFDGSTVNGLASEDVYAADFGYATGLYLTIFGNGNILGYPVTQKDIFFLRGQWVPSEWGGIVWHGPDWGWNYNIDAFDWPGD